MWRVVRTNWLLSVNRNQPSSISSFVVFSVRRCNAVPFDLSRFHSYRASLFYAAYKTANRAALIRGQWIHSFGILRHDLLLSFHCEVFTSDKLVDVFAELRARLMGKIGGAE